MADFCKQCSLTNFGQDFHDLEGLSTERQTKEGMYAHVICEGCGMTYVDHTGTCVYDCIEHHGALEKAK